MSAVKFPSLSDVLQQAGLSNKTGITFISGQESEDFLSYPELLSEAKFVLFNLLASGLVAGDELVLQIEDNRSFLVLFWACLLGGIIPVPLSTGGQDEHKQKVLSVWTVLYRPWLVTTDDQLQRVLEFARENNETQLGEALAGRALSLAKVLRKKEQQSVLPVITPENIAYIQYSSGSTGSPKGVVLTHANLLCNSGDIATRSQTGSGDRALSWMPLTHDMGMICFHLTALLADIDQYLLPTPLFVRRPSLWLMKASQHRVTQLYSPNFGYQYLLASYSREEFLTAGVDLSPVRIIYNGAEPIDAAVCRRFATELADFGLHVNAAYPGYGLAEASVAVTLPVPGEVLRVHYLDRSQLRNGQLVKTVDAEDPNAVSFVETGFPIEHCQLRIAGPTDSPLRDRMVGHIQIKGGNVTAGYYRLEAATRDVYTADGWLRTGDIGFVADGRLVITGREKNILIINGQNYYPHDIERVVLQLPGMEPGKVVACGLREPGESSDQLLLFILFKKPAAAFREVSAAVRQIVAEKTGLAVSLIIPVRKVPKTTSGKVQNFKLIEQYRQGEFNEVMHGLEAASGKGRGLAELWKKTTGLDLPGRRHSLLSEGVSSLGLMRFLTAVREETGKHITIRDLFEFPTIDGLEKLLVKAALDTPAGTCLVSGDGPLALTPTQRRFFFMEQLKPEGNPLGITYSFLLDGPLDVLKMREAVRLLRERHPVLGSFFRLTEEGPVQDFRPVSGDAFSYVESPSLIEAISRKAYDLESGDLFRVVGAKLENGQFQLSLMMHHLIGDGWTLTLLKKELLALYEGMPLAPALSPFGDYARWMAGYFESERYLADKQYWINQYEGFAFEPLFPVLSLEPGEHSSFSLSFAIGADRYTAIRRFTAEQQVSLLSVLLTAVTCWVYKYTGRADLPVTTDLHGRINPGLEAIAGCFINSLILRQLIKAEETPADLLQATHRQLLEAQAHQLYPADMALSHPLQEVVVLLQQFGEEAGDRSAEITQRVETSPAKLVIAFEEEAGGLTMRVDCQRRYFDEVQSRFLTGELNAALEGLVSRGREKLAGLDLLSAEEQQLLVNEYNQPVPVAEVDLIKVFEDRAEADPHADAVLFGDQVLSYAVLKEEVNKWANYLIEELSVGAGDRIGICLPRSEKTLILLLAVLKSGASYVLLDPEYPEERRQYMIADSGVRFVLDEEGYATAPVAAEMFPVADAAPAGVTGEAYVIYTSGTSGRPKGIPISRRALYDYVHVLSGELGFTAGDIVLQQSALSFDTLVEEVFPALYTGGTIHILAEGGRNVEAMLRAIEDGKATVLSTTPTVINELNKQAGRCEKLRVLISGGERMLYTQVDGLLQGNTIIYNSYGPSETTVCATYHRVKPGNGAVPIGRPLPNRVVYLLDADGNLAPWGAAGEIYIGGSGVSEGYVHLEEQTMSVFGDDKFMGAGRLYKTGDRARWRADGNLEFLGRKDRQVKIDGYRIETAEVEQRMAGYPGITAVAVLPRLVSGDRPVLAAYFSATGEIHFPELRAWLLDTLPFYMVPSAWEQLEVLPSTVNGKIDLEALGALVLTGTETGVLDETEFVLLEGFREVLGQPEGLNKKSNFFALGGNSLMATRLLLWIQRRWKISLNLKAIFSHPTLEELAVYIRQAATADTTASIPAVAGREFYPVSAGQRRLWLLEGFLGDKGAYNLNWAFEVSGGVDVDRLERAFSGLIARHEILRTNFCFRDGELFQVIHPDRKFAITVAETGGEIRRLISEQAVHPFDLEKDMLLRVVVAKMGAGRDLLILSMHHIITDAWSMDLLSAELSQAYNQMVPGEPAPAVQYKDFAVWQQAQLDSGAWDEHRRYWKQRFAGNVPVLPLAEDKPRPLVQTYNGRTIRIDIAENIKKPLARLAQDRSCSLFVVLLTAVKGFLSRITGETDLVIGTPVSGRVHPDISHQIGFFVNTLALRTTLRPGAGFEAMLDGVRVDFLEAFEHQAYPFDRLVEDLQLVKDTSRNPLFSVMVDLLNTETARNQPLQLDGLELTTCPPESVTSQVDLSFDFKESGPGLALELNYNTDIYTDDRMQRMLDGFVVFLEDIGVNSGKPVSELTYLPASERAAVLSFGGSGLAATDAPDLVTLFESVVSRCGGRTAISAGNSECSYLQLNETANRLARCLTSRYKVTRGVRVGILAGRSEQTIAAVLAVLKAGAAYVPIDSALNAERIQYLIKDSGISLLLTDGPVTIAVPKTVAVLDLAAFRLVAPGYGSDNLEEKPNARDLVYLIYTSGSTGRPKGVKIGHRPLLGLWESLGQAYGLEEFPVRLLQIASFSFDVFFGDLLRSIFRGGTLVLCPDAVRYDLPALQQLLQKERISILESTPGLLLPLLDYLYEENKGIGALRLLIMGSDSLSVEDLRRVSSRFAGSGLRLINSYGTTETCIDACFFEVNGETLPAAGYVPIGRPLTNMRIYVLDDKQGLCAVGVRGEICIGGYGIGEGYWDRDQLTKQRFIANPYAPGERLYRTGDMGSWTNAGVLEYHGRTDFQVKIRGYRVEIGEVESVLQGYAGLKEVVVLAQEMGRNDLQLVGYIVWAGTADGSLLADESGLREYCRQQLPLYMHPAHFVTLERLPLTGNGKIDRLRLPKVEAQENVN
ncbi:MAG TPA: amino acid adenylation domain-containing protein, partial [Puia sp.]